MNSCNTPATLLQLHHLLPRNLFEGESPFLVGILLSFRQRIESEISHICTASCPLSRPATSNPISHQRCWCAQPQITLRGQCSHCSSNTLKPMTESVAGQMESSKPTLSTDSPLPDYHMGLEDANLEERLKSFLVQLQTESGILERLIYKGKNQHRRCIYFQYLLKVRRDVRLLQSAHLGDILKHLFQLINGNRPSQAVHVLESLKRRKVDRGKANFLERLLGVARLLSEMVEPMLKAAIEISSLLARSFFMGFSLTVLALLARLRVLVQQMLLDVVSVFNMVSSLAQKKQSLKFIQEGIEVFREYYPSNDDVITLECIWKVDKFILLERTNRCDIKNQDWNLELKGDTSLGSSMIKYQSIEAWLGEDEDCNMDKGHTSEKLLGHSDAEQHKTDASPDTFIIGDNLTQVEDCENEEGHLENPRSPVKSSDLKSTIVASTTSPCLEPQSGSSQKVAFVSVRKSAMPETKGVGPVEATSNVQLPTDDREDSLFSLLGGKLKDSLF